ncbi:hypothetical protein RDWZM_006078 [Blomia tropicalis]|uniref:Uncharacterized protein n=1 Tax=Blomia tropicalis TaxID=40697 RepID=A0A9Q0RN10_BLOTA|nr:hypothetical protein RDWZM_006078 [Blomia tropicalis]
MHYKQVTNNQQKKRAKKRRTKKMLYERQYDRKESKSANVETRAKNVNDDGLCLCIYKSSKSIKALYSLIPLKMVWCVQRNSLSSTMDRAQCSRTGTDETIGNADAVP